MSCPPRILALSLLICLATKLVNAKAIAISGGTAKASSYWSSDWSPANAFKPDTPRGWHDGQSSGTLHFLWYEFSEPTLARNITFQSCRDGVSYRLNQNPKNFEFVGSNDAQCSKTGNWQVICSVMNDPPFESPEDVRGCGTDGFDEKFRCLGLKISDQTRVCLAKVKMWRGRPKQGDVNEKTPETVAGKIDDMIERLVKTVKKNAENLQELEKTIDKIEKFVANEGKY